jgi:hypothetical protein
MVRTASIFGLGREFDAFLFAPIGEEPNGMSLSVISALARSNIDPWQEAAKLARLPAKTATQRLNSLLTALPGVRFDSGAIATRLIALLPHAGATTTAAPETLTANVANKTFTNRSVLAFAIVWALILAIQSIAASHQQPPSPVATSSAAPAPGPTASHTAKPPSGK